MITTEQLYEWKTQAELTKIRSFDEAKKYANNTRLSEYFLFLGNAADAHTAILSRLIKQSETDDRNNGRAEQ